MSFDATNEPQRPVQPVSQGMPVWLIVLMAVGAAGLMMLVVVGVLVALMLPAIQAAREAARRTACVNNLRQIGIALQSYHEEYGEFPPAYVADEDGKPMHSWRVLILPYLDDADAAEVYEAYDFEEPWDGPNNRRLADRMPYMYGCPSSPEPHNQTHYVAIVGEGTVWPGDHGVTLRDVGLGDGMSNTIELIETDDSGILWLEPRDVTLEEAARGIHEPGGEPCIASKHPGGVNALFVDGSVHYLDEDTPPEDIRGMATIAGGEVIESQEFDF